MIRPIPLFLLAALVGCSKPPVEPKATNPFPAPTTPVAPPGTTAPTTAKEPVDDTIRIAAVALRKEYAADRKAATAKYGGKTLEVTGQVAKVNPSARSPRIVFIGDHASIESFSCVLKKEEGE